MNPDPNEQEVVVAKFGYPNINEVDVDDETVVDYVQGNFSPEEVFPQSELEGWAKANGFVRDED